MSHLGIKVRDYV